MKKIIGLSLISILSLAAFAQDSTTTTTKLNRKDSLQKNGMKNDSGMNSTAYRDSMSSNSTTSTMADSLKGTTDATAANSQMLDSLKAGSTTTQNPNNHQSNTSMSDSSSKVIGTDRVIMKDEKMYLVKKGDSSLCEATSTVKVLVVLPELGPRLICNAL